MMRPSIPLAVSALLLASPNGLGAQEGGGSPVGLWRYVDDSTGRERGVMRVYEQSGRLFARIERVNDPADRAKTCVRCSDERQGKPLVGLIVLRNLARDGEGWSGGDILDPESGSLYRASVRLEDGGAKLNVRGYVGTPLLGRSQTWLRTR